MAKGTLTLAAFGPGGDDDCHMVSDNRVQRMGPESLRRLSALVGVLDDREFAGYSFEVEKELAGESLAETVEIKMYQDAGLNPMLEYRIVHNARPSAIDPKSVSVQAFAISTASLEAETARVRAHTPYIDVLVPRSTLPYALYNAEILEKKGDVFIYYTKEAVHISIFDQGEFVYAKSGEGGLKKLHDDYLTMTGERTPYPEFLEKIVKLGLEEERYGQEEYPFLIDFRELLTTSLTAVNNIVLYARRIAGVREVDRVFIGTEGGPIPGADKAILNVLGLGGFDFLFYTPFYLEGDDYIDQCRLLALLEGANLLYGKPVNPFNATMSPRPSAFLARPSGRLAAATVGSLLLFSLYPAYLYSFAAYKDYQAETVARTLNMTKLEFTELKAKEDALLAEKKELQTKGEEIRKELETGKQLLEEVRRKKAGYVPVTPVFAKLSERVGGEEVFIERLLLEEGKIRMELRSEKERRLTSLVGRLVADGYRNVSMEAIEFDADAGYRAAVEMERSR